MKQCNSVVARISHFALSQPLVPRPLAVLSASPASTKTPVDAASRAAVASLIATGGVAPGSSAPAAAGPSVPTPKGSPPSLGLRKVGGLTMPLKTRVPYTRRANPVA